MPLTVDQARKLLSDRRVAVIEELAADLVMNARCDCGVCP